MSSGDKRAAKFPLRLNELDSRIKVARTPLIPVAAPALTTAPKVGWPGCAWLR